MKSLLTELGRANERRMKAEQELEDYKESRELRVAVEHTNTKQD